jgi:hypothetical protein
MPLGSIIRNLQNNPVRVTARLSNVRADAREQPDDDVELPWGSDPQVGWLDYRCWVETQLDPGTCLHKPLPQQDFPVDTLATVDSQSPTLDTFVSPSGGVNINSSSTAIDVAQRMATSTYHYILRGYGLRAGYQVPIPGIVQIGGRAPMPTFPQRATNMIVGNFSGVPIWYGVWELHYFVIQNNSPGAPPYVPVPFNPALHVRSDAELPGAIPVPLSVPDTNHSFATPPPSPLQGGVAQ